MGPIENRHNLNHLKSTKFIWAPFMEEEKQGDSLLSNVIVGSKLFGLQVAPLIRHLPPMEITGIIVRLWFP